MQFNLRNTLEKIQQCCCSIIHFLKWKEREERITILEKGATYLLQLLLLFYCIAAPRSKPQLCCPKFVVKHPLLFSFLFWNFPKLSFQWDETLPFWQLAKKHDAWELYAHQQVWLNFFFNRCKWQLSILFKKKSELKRKVWATKLWFWSRQCNKRATAAAAGR